jgi:hypothetical protein
MMISPSAKTASTGVGNSDAANCAATTQAVRKARPMARLIRPS